MDVRAIKRCANKTVKGFEGLFFKSDSMSSLSIHWRRGPYLYYYGGYMKNKMFLILALVLATAACNNGSVAFKDLDSSDIYLLDTSSQRLKNQDKYFADEYAQINRRRGHQNFAGTKPNNMIGIALSGGGIRSSAYQLGLLSGLYKKNALANIDYISSVSGGSWANGAYWAWNSSDEEFFGCLDKAAKLGVEAAKCKAAQMLNVEQPFAELPIDFHDSVKLNARKRQWKEYIERIYLPDCNVKADNINKNGISAICLENYNKKPYIIINASHSVSIFDQKGSEKNMPFQFTPDNLGMLSDCYKETCEDRKSGFFVKSLSPDFSWINDALFRADVPGNSLSAAMAASSGVLAGAMALSYEYELLTNERVSILGNHRGDNIKEIRKEIVLSDGGKAENLGLVPLIERGVNLVIVSYMGLDNNLEKNPWEDLDLAAKQAENLLGCNVETPETADLKNKFIHESLYSCGTTGGKLLHVKASYENAKHFIKFLENNKYDDLVKYLQETDLHNNKKEPKNRFPQTKTMKKRYDEELIRAYYLFGQWMAEEHLTKYLTN